MKPMRRLIAALSCATLAFAAVLTAQTPSLDTAGLEAYLRHLMMWPESVHFTMSAPVPAPLPGFFQVNVKGSIGDQSKEESFYVSADSKTVIRGDVFDVRKNPFQADLDLLKTGDQPFLGVPGAPVTLVEFADFQCPYCKQEAGILRTQLMEAFPGQIQLIFMDYPLDPIHPFAHTAAILGRCIYEQNNGSFWNYHDWMFLHQSEFKTDNLRAKTLEFAKGDKNLNAEQLNSCSLAQPARDAVARSIAIGDALKINATPTLFINGRRMVGAISLDDLKLVVSHEIAWAKSQKKDTDCCSVQLALPGTAPASPLGESR